VCGKKDINVLINMQPCAMKAEAKQTFRMKLSEANRDILALGFAEIEISYSTYSRATIPGSYHVCQWLLFI